MVISTSRSSSSTTPKAAATASATCASGARSRARSTSPPATSRSVHCSPSTASGRSSTRSGSSWATRSPPDQEGDARGRAKPGRARCSTRARGRQGGEPVPRGRRRRRRGVRNGSDRVPRLQPRTSSTRRPTSRTAELDVIGSQALVGSSNFTRPGLTQNVELNIKIESSAEVAQLQEWYERHWD